MPNIELLSKFESGSKVIGMRQNYETMFEFSDLFYLYDQIYVCHSYILAESRELLDMIADLSPEQPVKQTNGTEWSHRRDRISDEWSTHRQLLMNEIVRIQGEAPPQHCSNPNCKNQVTIR